MNRLERIHVRQSVLLNTIYDIVYHSDIDEKLLDELNGEYEKLVKQALEEAGNDAHCCEVDRDLWEVFCGEFNEKYGVQPCHHVTYQEVRDWRLAESYLNRVGCADHGCHCEHDH